MPEIKGHCDERFTGVAQALQRQLDRGDDVGASVAVALHSELVVDLWGGFRDAARSQPWERDTIVNVMSTTKTMVAVCALLLVDHGELDLNARVAAYWSEFAQEGKGEVRVRHLLGHTAGLPAWDHDVSAPDLADWERCTSRLAAQAPRWERRLLSEHAVSAIFSEQANGFDVVLLTPVRWGIGYGLVSESMPIGARACQWGGHGGSVVFNDQDTGLTVAYAMNQMKPEGDMRGSAIISAAKSSLEPLWRRAARQGRRASRAARRRLRA